MPEEREMIYSNPGDPIQVTYKLVIDDDGKKSLKPSGKFDLYADIQSHKDSVDINVLLQRFAQGDYDVLQRRQGTYGDFTSMPTSYAEMFQRAMDAQSYFDSLPAEVKREFNFSATEFFSSLGTPKVAEVFEKFKAPEPVQPVEPVPVTPVQPVQSVETVPATEEVKKGGFFNVSK